VPPVARLVVCVGGFGVVGHVAELDRVWREGALVMTFNGHRRFRRPVRQAATACHRLLVILDGAGATLLTVMEMSSSSQRVWRESMLEKRRNSTN